MARVPAELPSHLIYIFYGLVAWGLSATLAAFRILAGDNVKRGIVLRIAAVAWLGLPMLLAQTGMFHDFGSTPPNLMKLVFPMLVGVIVLCASPWGRYAANRLPESLLVGTQAFRFPLELLLFSLAQQGVLAMEMTLGGYNFDIVTGILALPLWWALRALKAPSWAVWAWNFLGLGLLIIVVAIAVLGFPEPFGWFQPPNLIVAFFPWIWLPTFLVPVALISHLLLIRKMFLPRAPVSANV